ncbi:hypothetical protein MT487_01560 [Lachnospiraceae bacterium NSJ-171]|nr:hypothetical protein [Lachnospiraceae bacterium NSJ-171]
MRLIEADELMDFISEYAEQIQYAIEHKNMEILESLIKQIPTAYDVDKVIKELERLKETEQNRQDECDEEGYGDAEQIFSDGESQGKFRAYIKAIEVVKAG